MTIMQDIKTAQIEARKSKNELKASILTVLIGEAGMIGKNAGNRETTDSEVLAVVKKFIKNIDETQLILSKDEAKNSDKLDVLKQEKFILQSFMPKQMSLEEVSVAIKTIVSEMSLSGPKAMGIIMKEMKLRYDGNYDGATVSKLCKEILV